MSNDGGNTMISHKYVLDSENELRFEVAETGEKITLELLSGLAEVFGSEIVKNKLYEFSPGSKAAVFTWQGCSIEIKGKTDGTYIAKETPMLMYFNCHAALEQLREEAERENKRGPVTMIVGPRDVGKSTLSNLLLNYAARVGRRPIFVDLDVGQGNISIPGTFGALMVERPATVGDGFSQEAPLVFHFGHVTLQKNIALYNHMYTCLAGVLNERIQVNKNAKTSGFIINTPGWILKEGYRQILKIAQNFEVDVILVLDHERLYNDLARDIPQCVKVVYLPKSGGVVERSKEFRIQTRDQRVRNYFYGGRTPFYPHSFDVKWSEAKVYKIGAPALPDSCMPLGMKPLDHLMKLVPVTPGPSILHHILAISYATSAEDDVLSANVAGFVCVTAVDVDRQVFTILSPQPRPLPSTIFLLSDVQFMDSH